MLISICYAVDQKVASSIKYTECFIYSPHLSIHCGVNLYNTTGFNAHANIIIINIYVLLLRMVFYDTDHRIKCLQLTKEILILNYLKP